MNREVICFDAVAPARERGLKSVNGQSVVCTKRRSREGAWIEINGLAPTWNVFFRSLPRGSVD